jgi:hypothetical protein
MLNNGIKKQILSSFLRTVQGISDKEYQKRVWINGEGPEIDDFDETVCNFFQDCDGIIKNHKDFGITNKQHDLLIDFRKEFDCFCNGPGLKYYLPELFIDIPEWEKIRQLASEILLAFNYKG